MIEKSEIVIERENPVFGVSERGRVSAVSDIPYWASAAGRTGTMFLSSALRKIFFQPCGRIVRPNVAALPLVVGVSTLTDPVAEPSPPNVSRQAMLMVPTKLEAGQVSEVNLLVVPVPLATHLGAAASGLTAKPTG